MLFSVQRTQFTQSPLVHAESIEFILIYVYACSGFNKMKIRLDRYSFESYIK